jgi:hypothetical protein
MDMKARTRWYDYTEAKDDMFKYTDTEISPWYGVNANHKESARLNYISHLLNQIPYKEVHEKQLKVSKSTLIEWPKVFQPGIRHLRNIELEPLREKLDFWDTKTWYG